MKNLVRIIIVLIILTSLIRGQEPEWFNFTNGDQITAIAQEFDTLWVGTTCGLVKINKVTDQTLEHLNSANSDLPNVEILDIVIGSNNEKWIGTRQGLAKLAGNDWTLYDTNDGLPSQVVNTLTLDTDGLPIVGTLSNGLGIYHSDTDDFSVINTTTEDNLPSNLIRDLAFDDSNNWLWIATADGLARRTTDDLWQTWYQSPGGLPSDELSAVAFDSEGVPWVGTPGSGLAEQIAQSDWDFYQSGAAPGFPDNNIRAIAFDNVNVPWVGTENGGLAYYPGTSWIAYSFPGTGIPANAVHAIHIDELNDKWIGTTQGLAKLSGSVWSTSYVTSNSELPSPSVQNLASRNQNEGLWISTGNVVTLYDGAGWNTYEGGNAPAAPIRSILVDHGGTLFVGTEGAGVYLFSNSVWENHISPGYGIPGNYILTSVMDASYTVWVSTEKGLGKYDGADWIPYTTQEVVELQTNDNTVIAADHEDNLWLFAQNFVIRQFNTITEEVTLAPDGITATYVLDMTVDNENNLWVGTDQGLWVLKNETWEWETVDPDLPSNIIRALTVSKSGNLWIGTSQGLVKYAPGDTSWYTVKNSGLIDNGINDLAFDINGNLWVGTERGLALYTVEEVGSPQLALSAYRIDFGNVMAGDSATQTLQIQNIGSAELDITDTQLINTQDGVLYEETHSAPSPFDPGSQGSISVKFKPVLGGTFQAFLVIYSNSPTSPDTVRLQGSSDQAMLNFNPSSLDFGILSPDEDIRKSVIITNPGAAELSIYESYILGSEDFELVQGGDPATVSPHPDSTHIIIVNFTPQSGGIKEADLIVISNAPSSPDTLSMTGSGGSPLMAVHPDPWMFGRVVRNTTKIDTLSMINIGNQELQIYNAAIDPPGSQFSVVFGPEPALAAPGDTSFLSVAFAPAELLPDTAYLIIESNTAQGLNTVQLTGRGTLFQINPDILPSKLSSDSSFSITLASGAQIFDRIFLYYRSSGQADWDSLEFERGLLDYTVELEAAEIPPDGLAYYIARINSVTQEKTILSGSDDATANWLIVVSPSVASEKISLPETYGMLTIPYHLTERNIGRVFTDELGSYNTKLWRVFYWWNDSAADTAYYREYRPGEALWNSEPGKAFWVITHEGIDFDIDNVLSVDSRTPYQILLQKGWNQIGNPFTFPVAWSSVSVRGASVDPPVASYDEEYFYDQTVLNPWEGYFVYANGSAELLVPPVSASPLPKSGRGKECKPGEIVIQLSARDMSSGFTDQNNYVGMLRDASDIKDACDYLKPPAIRNTLQLNILEQRLRFSANYKQISTKGACWELEIKSASGTGLAEIVLNQQTDIPDHFHIWLLDLDHGASIPLQNHQAKIHPPRRLKLILGTLEYAEIQREDIPLSPQHFRLRQNYPNPFNPTTTIDFQLAERTRVRLEIYNVLGECVQTWIYQTLPAGNHTKFWDGTDAWGRQCASGLYFYRLSTPHFTATKKMIRLQ
ncbi:choice-of-anchor D domain-containing protein [bacterium]|nr:choice-of-anchor D domain-containing protein [bacterium]